MDLTPIISLLMLLLGGGFVIALFGVLFMTCVPLNIPALHWQADLPEDERHSHEEPYDPPDHDDYFEEDLK
jgi:hypothetical protein